MNSWHFVDSYLILVSGINETRFRAATIENGATVSCSLNPGDIQPSFDRAGTSRCQAACADALWQRKAKTGFRSASDVMERVTSRWGESQHDIQGVPVKIERETNGDFVATANHHFESISLRLRVRDGTFEEIGSQKTGGFDYELEQLYQGMKGFLSKRRDWDMASRLMNA